MTKKGILIYNQIDYEKNKWFANELITTAPKYGLELSLVLHENLILTIEEGQFLAFYPSNLSPIVSCSVQDLSPAQSAPLNIPSNLSPTSSCPVQDLSPTSSHAMQDLSPLSLDDRADSSTDAKSEVSPRYSLSTIDVDFVINRTRDTLVATHFEKMGCRVFNNSEVTELCNHKGKTHQLVNGANIPSVKTLLGNVHYFNPETLPFNYPVILKSVSGHGGSEVFKINNQSELTHALDTLRTEDFVLQELCANPGIDVRVFALGKKILAAVKRTSTSSFKSNYSLGGSATAYSLTPEEEAMVNQILSLADFDFVGIDFIFNKEGQFLFNEIEDVVGTRTLYLNYDFDVVALFLQYIAATFSYSVQ